MSTEASERPVEHFYRLCEVAVARLPFGLNSVVTPTFVGFVVLNGATFAFDLVLLTLLRGGLGATFPVAVTVAYVVVVLVNYLAFILGLSSALAAAGVEYHVARIVAGGCEAAYMYSAMRWMVFRR
jgi:hypothetical protein